MARMVRKQVYITPEHDAALKRRARELGVTESDLIRRGIEQIARHPPRRDERAVLDLLSFLRERAARLRGTAVAASTTGTGRGWTREELYDRRPPHAPR